MARDWACSRNAPGRSAQHRRQHRLLRAHVQLPALARALAHIGRERRAGQDVLGVLVAVHTSGAQPAAPIGTAWSSLSAVSSPIRIVPRPPPDRLLTSSRPNTRNLPLSDSSASCVAPSNSGTGRSSSSPASSVMNCLPARWRLNMSGELGREAVAAARGRQPARIGGRRDHVHDARTAFQVDHGGDRLAVAARRRQPDTATE